MGIAKKPGIPDKRPWKYWPHIALPLHKISMYRRIESVFARHLRRITQDKILFRALDKNTKEIVNSIRETQQLGGTAFGALYPVMSGTVAYGMALEEGSQIATATAAMFGAGPSLAISSRLDLMRKDLWESLKNSSNNQIQGAFKKSKYFFVDARGNVIFTHSNPFVSLRKRISTTDKAYGAGKPHLPTRIVQHLGEIGYLRTFWPLFGGLTTRPLRRYKRLLQAADIKKGQTVVEIAAGAVPYYLRFRTAVGKEGKLIVSDVSPRVIGDSHRLEKVYTWFEKFFSRNSGKAQPIPRAIDVEKLPLENNSVDRIVGSYVYFVDVPEAVRVLKIGGKVVIAEGGGCNYNGLTEMERKGKIKKYDKDGCTVLEKIAN